MEDVPPVPTTSNEFLRVWRRQCKTPAQRYAFLRQLEPETLPLLFRTELDAALFDGIVGALGERVGSAAGGGGGGSGDADAELSWAAGLLQSMARINRFELTLDFADAKTSASLKAIFDALQQQRDAPSGDAAGPAALDAALDAAPFASLRATYKV